MSLMKLITLVLLVAIVGSLGSALFHLSREGDSKAMLRALTVRIGLSVLLFLVLLAGWRAGYIQPHGLGR